MKVIDELHASHAGISQLMSLVSKLCKLYVVWPEMDADLESKVKTANSISRTRNLHQLYQCRHASGQSNLGEESTLTMLAHFQEKMFLW